MFVIDALMDGIADLQWFVEKRFGGRVTEVSPRADGTEFMPLEGWHTIRVGTYAADPGSLNTWLRLFEHYAENCMGSLYWRDALHFDRDKREITGTFCIQ